MKAKGEWRGEWFRGKTKEMSIAWKGDSAKYCAKHAWIHRNYGKANHCVECGIAGKKRYEWANISGEYKRDVSDYQQMCVSCHRKMDYSKSGKCRKGHLMTEENTYKRRDGNRACKKCGLEASKRYMQRRKEFELNHIKESAKI